MQTQPNTPRLEEHLSVSNAIATPTTLYDSNWYPNSGASHHKIPDAANLMEKMDYQGSQQVLIGNGAGLTINHVGNSKFQPSFSSSSLKLNNLLYVPHITKNLSSV